MQPGWTFNKLELLFLRLLYERR